MGIKYLHKFVKFIQYVFFEEIGKNVNKRIFLLLINANILQCFILVSRRGYYKTHENRPSYELRIVTNTQDRNGHAFILKMKYKNVGLHYILQVLAHLLKYC